MVLTWTTPSSLLRRPASSRGSIRRSSRGTGRRKRSHWRKPSATLTASPPFFPTDQIPEVPPGERSQNTRVELRAITAEFVESFGASAMTSDWNSAVTFASDWRVSWQLVDVPLQAPPQPMKRVALAGLAVRVTVLPPDTMTSQVAADSPQFSPPPVTVPGPLTDAVRCTCAGVCTTKFAKTVASFDSVNVHADGPLQSL